jgi:DNA-binding beta-propeller fold protein YncE
MTARLTLPALLVLSSLGLPTTLVHAAEPAKPAVAQAEHIPPVVPLSNADRYKQQSAKLVPGVYQSDISHKNNALFVTSAVGRPPVKASQLLKLDPVTLAITAQITPATLPGAAGEGAVFAVYGVGVDDRNGNVWTTNTRQNSVAVYRQADLKLVKQFEPDSVAHARDVVVDSELNHAFAGATGTPVIAMFDAGALTLSKNIEIQSTVKDGKFSVASLDLDPQTHTLYTVSLSTNEAAVIDAKTGTVEKVLPIEGVSMAMGVAHDAKTNRLFVTGQRSDNLAIVDLASGKTLHNVVTGGGPLNVAFDPVKRLAYVSNRTGGTVTVVDPDGKIVANLENGTFPNHVLADGKGDIYAVNKSKGPDDASGDRITRLSPVN